MNNSIIRNIKLDSDGEHHALVFVDQRTENRTVIPLPNYVDTDEAQDYLYFVRQAVEGILVPG